MSLPPRMNRINSINRLRPHLRPALPVDPRPLSRQPRPPGRSSASLIDLFRATFTTKTSAILFQYGPRCQCQLTLSAHLSELGRVGSSPLPWRKNPRSTWPRHRIESTDRSTPSSTGGTMDDGGIANSIADLDSLENPHDSICGSPPERLGGRLRHQIQPRCANRPPRAPAAASIDSPRSDAARSLVIGWASTLATIRSAVRSESGDVPTT